MKNKNKHFKSLLLFVLIVFVLGLFSGCDFNHYFKKGIREGKIENLRQNPWPRVDFKTVPTEPKRGDEVSVFATALYYTGKTEDLYYMWFINNTSIQPLMAGDELFFVPDVSKLNSTLPTVPGLKNDYGIFYIMDYADANFGVPEWKYHADSMVVTRTTAKDTDRDGMDDDWEMFYFGDLSHGPGEDFDDDGYIAKSTSNTSSSSSAKGVIASATAHCRPYKIYDEDGNVVEEGCHDFDGVAWAAASFYLKKGDEIELDGTITYYPSAEVEGGGAGGGGEGGSGGSGWGEGDTGSGGGAGGEGGEGGEGGRGGQAEVTFPAETIDFPSKGSSDGRIILLYDLGGGNKTTVFENPGTYTAQHDGRYVLKVQVNVIKDIAVYGEVKKFISQEFPPKTIAPDAYNPITDTYHVSGDGIMTNYEEYVFGSNPIKGDTDEDGFRDEQDIVGLGQNKITFTIPEDLPPDVKYYRLDTLALGISQKKQIVNCPDKTYVALSGEELTDIKSADCPADWGPLENLANGNDEDQMDEWPACWIGTGTYEERLNATDTDADVPRAKEKSVHVEICKTIYQYFKLYIEPEEVKELEVKLSTEDLYPSVGEAVEIIATPYFSQLDYYHLFYDWVLTYKDITTGDFIGITDQATSLEPPGGSGPLEGRRTFKFTPAVAGTFKVEVFVAERVEDYKKRKASGKLIIEAGSKIELQFNSGTQPPNLLTGDIFTVTAQPTFECTKENVDNPASYCAYVWYLDGQRQKNVPGSPQEFRLVVDKPAGSKYKLKVTGTNIDGSETATKEVELFVYSPDVKIIPIPDTRRPTTPVVIADVKTGDTVTLQASPGPANSTFADALLSYTWTIDGVEILSEDFKILGIVAGVSADGKTLTLLIERKKGSRYRVGLATTATGDDKNPAGRKATDEIILEVVETPCKEVGASCTTNEDCCSGNCEEGVCRPILLGFFGSMFAAVGFFIPESFKLALKVGLAGLGILILVTVVFSIIGSWNYPGPRKKQ